MHGFKTFLARKLLNMFKAAKGGGMSSTNLGQDKSSKGEASATPPSNCIHYGSFSYVSSLFEIVKGVKLDGRIVIESDYIYEKEFGSPNVKVEYVLPSDFKHVYDISIIRKYTLNEYSEAFKALLTILKKGLPEDQLPDLLTSILKNLKLNTLEELIKRATTKPKVSTSINLGSLSLVDMAITACIITALTNLLKYR